MRRNGDTFSTRSFLHGRPQQRGAPGDLMAAEPETALRRIVYPAGSAYEVWGFIVLLSL